MIGTVTDPCCAPSSTSFALAPKTETLERRLVSITEADNIATARIESYELGAQQGSVTVPINVGQELWDYIKATDSQSSDSKEGNIRRLVYDIVGPTKGQREVFDMEIFFGTDVLSPITATLPTGSDLAVTVNDLISRFNTLNQNLTNALMLIEALYLRERVHKWHVDSLMIIPVV